jgi:dihydrodipicolinate reductase
MAKIAIAGVAGRMGRTLVELAKATDGVSLVAGFEAADSPFLGQDVGLLAGENDMQLLQQSGVGRDINRHYYIGGEVEAALQRPVVRRLCALIKLRNTHAAFNGNFSIPAST